MLVAQNEYIKNAEDERAARRATKDYPTSSSSSESEEEEEDEDEEKKKTEK